VAAAIPINLGAFVLFGWTNGIEVPSVPDLVAMNPVTGDRLHLRWHIADAARADAAGRVADVEFDAGNSRRAEA
jgi:hypothetical protein